MEESVRRRAGKFPVNRQSDFIKRALLWASEFTHFAYFTPNDFDYLNGAFPHFLAVGAKDICTSPEKGGFKSLEDFYNKKKDWLIGYLTYDLKNDIEKLESKNPVTVGFDALSFFQPETIIFFHDQEVQIHTFGDPEVIWQKINCCDLKKEKLQNATSVKARVSKQQYIDTLRDIRERIINGDVYEINYCIEFIGRNKNFDPMAAFLTLNKLSPMPFATFQRFKDKCLISASPERFLKKKGDKLVSQPIKGTIGRGKDKAEDELFKNKLLNSEKERAENMMIVDLVRNDLAKSAVPGTVKVDELFGIYTYEKVHQMVSTVSAQARPLLNFVDVIKNAFPMGSMTGAPKVSAMKLIEKYESSKRGLFSGAAGFIDPSGDFDFNVIIRSLMYDGISGDLSFQVGGAITYDSDPEQEYAECLLKAKAIMQVLQTSPERY